MDRVRFLGNQAKSGAGALYLDAVGDGTPSAKLSNLLFAGNRLTTAGPSDAIVRIESSFPSLEVELAHVTAADNSAVTFLYAQPEAFSPANTVTVTFAPALPDQDACTVTLDCGASVCVRGCEGDLNRSGDTTASDSLQAKIRFGQTADETNAEWDFNLSGDISSADALQIKIRFGFTAPSCP